MSLIGLGAATAACLVAGPSAPTPMAPHAIATFREMPKTVTLPDGTLFAFFHSLTGEMGAATARTSTDDGKTWSPAKTLFALPSESGAFGYTQAFIDHSGELHLFMFCDNNTGQIRPVPDASKYGPLGQLDIWEAHTADQRQTWLPPHRIWQGRAGDMLSVFQLTSGRIILPLSYYIPGRSWENRGTGFDAFNWMGSFRSSALYSDDGGNTWSQSPSVLEVPCNAIGQLGAIEPVGVQLKDGRIWMLIRTQVGRFYETWSRDGATWTPARATNLTSSDSPAGLIRLKDGRMVLFENDCQRYPYADGGRQVLHAAISDDDGKTWRGWREVWRDPLRDLPPPPGGDYGASYVFPTLTRSGNIIFSMWVQSGNTRQIVEFDPNWLDETSQTEDFSNGLDELSTFATQGVSVVEDPSRPANHALQIRKPDAAWPAAAVWNFPACRSGEITFRLRLNPGHRSILIGLTNHYSPPSDDQDEIYNVYNLKIGPDGRVGTSVALQDGEWHDVAIHWDTARKQCSVAIDDHAAAAVPQQLLCHFVNYLRFRSTAAGADQAGFLVEDIHQSGQTGSRPSSGESFGAGSGTKLAGGAR